VHEPGWEAGPSFVLRHLPLHPAERILFPQHSGAAIPQGCQQSSWQQLRVMPATFANCKPTMCNAYIFVTREQHHMSSDAVHMRHGRTIASINEIV
jgi:hypothetical protein